MNVTVMIVGLKVHLAILQLTLKSIAHIPPEIEFVMAPQREETGDKQHEIDNIVGHYRLALGIIGMHWA